MDIIQEQSFTLIIYHSSLDSLLMEYLEELELNCFTQWSQVKGQGRSSEPHLDTHIWPGTNNAIAIMTDEKSRKILYKVVSRIREKAPGEGIKAFTLPLMGYT